MRERRRWSFTRLISKRVMNQWNIVTCGFWQRNSESGFQIVRGISRYEYVFLHHVPESAVVDCEEIGGIYESVFDLSWEAFR